MIRYIYKLIYMLYIINKFLFLFFFFLPFFKYIILISKRITMIYLKNVKKDAFKHLYSNNVVDNIDNIFFVNVDNFLI
jgi:hypothetical protein